MSGIETRVARVLAVGTRIAIALLAVGTILLVLEGTSPLAAGWPPLDLASLPAGLVALEPAAFLWTGLIATIATPLLRVGTATWGFERAGERRMAALGVAVLVVIVLAIGAGLAAG
jgi:uncharacterized membrane protein